MSILTLVLGEAGSGKSTSMRNLDSNSTFIINVLDKPLPLKGYKKKYKPYNKSNPDGNYFASDNYEHIVKCIQKISSDRPDIKALIIDDIQYILSHEFLKRAHEKSWDKYAEMAVHYHDVIHAAEKARDDLLVICMSHNDVDNNGKSRMKTIGKMLNQNITIEGKFTLIFHTQIVNDKFCFQVQSDDMFTARTPMGMFEDKYIDNDLNLVLKAVKEYYQDEEEENEVSAEQSSETKEDKVIDK